MGNTRDLFKKTGAIKGTFHARMLTINNRMGKTRDLVKRTGAIKGTFHARMGMEEDRNGKDLKEVEEIKKRWQEYTEELYKKRSS